MDERPPTRPVDQTELLRGMCRAVKTGSPGAADRGSHASFAFVLAAEDPATLQLRYDLVDEIVEPAGQVREHHVESVAPLPRRATPPFGRRSGPRAHHRQAADSFLALRHLAHGEIVALSPVRRSARGRSGSASVAGSPEADRREQNPRRRGRARSRARRCRRRSAPAVEQGALLARLVDRVADDHEGAGRIFRWSGSRPSFSMRPFTSA